MESPKHVVLIWLYFVTIISQESWCAPTPAIVESVTNAVSLGNTTYIPGIFTSGLLVIPFTPSKQVYVNSNIISNTSVIAESLPSPYETSEQKIDNTGSTKPEDENSTNKELTSTTPIETTLPTTEGEDNDANQEPTVLKPDSSSDNKLSDEEIPSNIPSENSILPITGDEVTNTNLDSTILNPDSSSEDKTSNEGLPSTALSEGSKLTTSEDDATDIKLDSTNLNPHPLSDDKTTSDEISSSTPSETSPETTEKEDSDNNHDSTVVNPDSLSDDQTKNEEIQSNTQSEDSTLPTTEDEDTHINLDTTVLNPDSSFDNKLSNEEITSNPLSNSSPLPSTDKEDFNNNHDSTVLNQDSLSDGIVPNEEITSNILSDSSKLLPIANEAADSNLHSTISKPDFSSEEKIPTEEMITTTSLDDSTLPTTENEETDTNLHTTFINPDSSSKDKTTNEEITSTTSSEGATLPSTEYEDTIKLDSTVLYPEDSSGDKTYYEEITNQPSNNPVSPAQETTLLFASPSTQDKTSEEELSPLSTQNEESNNIPEAPFLNSNSFPENKIPEETTNQPSEMLSASNTEDDVSLTKSEGGSSPNNVIFDSPSSTQVLEDSTLPASENEETYTNPDSKVSNTDYVTNGEITNEEIKASHISDNSIIPAADDTEISSIPEVLSDKFSNSENSDKITMITKPSDNSQVPEATLSNINSNNNNNENSDTVTSSIGSELESSDNYLPAGEEENSQGISDITPVSGDVMPSNEDSTNEINLPTPPNSNLGSEVQQPTDKINYQYKPTNNEWQSNQGLQYPTSNQGNDIQSSKIETNKKPGGSTMPQASTLTKPTSYIGSTQGYGTVEPSPNWYGTHIGTPPQFIAPGNINNPNHYQWGNLPGSGVHPNTGYTYNNIGGMHSLPTGMSYPYNPTQTNNEETEPSTSNHQQPSSQGVQYGSPYGVVPGNTFSGSSTGQSYSPQAPNNGGQYVYLPNQGINNPMYSGTVNKPTYGQSMYTPTYSSSGYQVYVPPTNYAYQPAVYAKPSYVVVPASNLGYKLSNKKKKPSEKKPVTSNIVQQ